MLFYVKSRSSTYITKNKRRAWFSAAEKSAYVAAGVSVLYTSAEHAGGLGVVSTLHESTHKISYILSEACKCDF